MMPTTRFAVFLPGWPVDGHEHVAVEVVLGEVAGGNTDSEPGSGVSVRSTSYG